MKFTLSSLNRNAKIGHEKKRFVSFDWVIKYMFRDKSNYVIVEGFLSELLGQSIQIQNILESESNKVTQTDKYNRVDVLVKNQHGDLTPICHRVGLFSPHSV